MQKTLTIIGGGAAGFFCAVNAARLHPELHVVLLEKTGKLLSKVKVSGGGRCNVTHNCDSIAEMVKNYPRGGSFLKKAFHHFFTTDTIGWFAERGVTLKTEADGRMFPVTDNSQTIIDCLLTEAARYKVDVQTNRDVKSFRPQHNKWVLTFANGAEITTDRLCIAAGGSAKADHYKCLADLGHVIEAPIPSLFTFNMPAHPIRALAGVTVADVAVKITGEKNSTRGPLLITHWGMSGPAVLKMSAFAARTLADKHYHFSAFVNWLPEFNEQTLKERLLFLRFENAAQKIENRNPFQLPARLWEFILNECGIASGIRWTDLPAAAQNKLAKTLCAHEFAVSGKTTFKEEFVTAGGVSTDAIDVNTMQSRITPGLYFAGEVINVDGVTGGFNFQNAWTTAMIAARAAGG